MIIQLSELKVNPAKYFDFTKRTDVIVTRHGKRPGRIVCEEEAAKSEKQRAIESFVGSGIFPSEYDDLNYDPDYELARESDHKARGVAL